MNSEVQEWKDHYQTALDGWAKSRKEINLLRAERDSLRADKERIDWLNGLVADIDMIPSDQVLNQGEGRLLWKMQFEYPEITRDGEETLRDAIDAARAERKEQE